MPVEVRPPDSVTDYGSLVERVRALVRATTPPGAAVLVVSRGDGMLVDLPGWSMGHFPQSPTGMYAGHYPADGEAAIAHLSELRARGAQYLMIPATALWWLEHYGELRAWLAAKASTVADEPGTGRVFRLVADDEADPRRAPESGARTAPQVSRLLRALLPPGAGVVLIGLAAESVDVDDRPAWRLLPPRGDTCTSVEDVLGAIAAARSSGAQYAALLIPEDRSAAPDGALRRELGRRFRRVCAQRLIELFAIAAAGDGGA
jgi:hypothetical protein